MPLLMFLKPGNTDMFEIYEILIPALLFLWALNALINWLMTKPWAKHDIPEPPLDDNNHTSLPSPV